MAVDASPGPGRVLLALSAGPLVAEPTWARYDTLTDCRCYGFDCYAGRQSELDVTNTGTATVYFHDRTGTLDDDALVGVQIMLQLYNPVSGAWRVRWRGHVDDVQHGLVDLPSAPKFANVALSCVGIFDYLGGCKMLPGVFGNPPPAGTNGVVFYEDGRVDDRIVALLTDAKLDPAMTVVFTGNVNVNETLYDPTDVVLQGLRDAADAEFPGIANVYEDRFGRVAFHGRQARFDPEGTQDGANWVFHRWHAATRADVTTGRAQIREFSFNRPRARIINSYLAWPRADENGVTFDQSLIPTLLQTDASSISSYGYRGDEAPDLIVKDAYVGGAVAADLCVSFGQFYITNYSQPRKAIQQVVLRSLDPVDARADATWNLMCNCDISDAINLTVAEAGLSDAPYFVDGVQVECRTLSPAYDLVSVTPNLTPASYYADDPFS